MVFSNPSFLYYFLPISLILYFLTPMPKGSPRFRNITLLVVSLVFYAWGEPRYVFLMIAQCFVAWIFGLLIEKNKGKTSAKALMITSIIISASGLVYFKYANFFISNVNNFVGSGFPLIAYLMPIGISFYTFQLISYTVDLYRGTITAERNVLAFSTYVASFPQLIAGPIVRYTDVAEALKNRVHSWSRFAFGARRFIIGLGKKMLLANMFGELVEIYKLSGNQSTLFTWLYLVAFSLQIYFDFSGYTDMAIGLGHIFGFKFPENFNYPYIADSITNFWRRWHMTLTGWFRDYVYIPLGGNRVKVARHILNILIIWMLTGFWHGANWNFILWGTYFAIVMLGEKFIFGRLLKKAPRVLKHLYVIIIIFVSWAFFDATTFQEAFFRIGKMFGFGSEYFAGSEALYYLRSYAVPLVAGIIGVTPLVKKVAQKISTKEILARVLEPIVFIVILFISTASMVDGTFNPFIYFRF